MHAVEALGKPFDMIATPARWWNARHAPTGSAPAVDDLPREAALTALGARTRRDMVPLATPPMTGEGIWNPVSGLVTPSGALEVTFFRPDPDLPSVSAAIVRIDQSVTRLVSALGAHPPDGSGCVWGSQVPSSERTMVVATFDGGSRCEATWRAPRSQHRHTWRSGLGIDAQSRLLYSAGSPLTLAHLASTLLEAEAVGVMQLGVGSGHVNFTLIRPDPAATTGVRASKLIESMPRTATNRLTQRQRVTFGVVALPGTAHPSDTSA